MKENEENRGLNNKKAYEEQFMDFCQCFLLTVLWWSSLSILSLTLREFLEHAWTILVSLGFGGRRKGNQESTREQVDQRIQLDIFASIKLHVCFPY